MNIKFLATVAVIAPDPMNSRGPYVEALGLPLDGEGDGVNGAPILTPLRRPKVDPSTGHGSSFVVILPRSRSFSR